MKRILPLLALTLLLSLSLLFTACNDDPPQDGPATDGETNGGESENPSHLPEYGDNVVDFDTIA